MKKSERVCYDCKYFIITEQDFDFDWDMDCAWGIWEFNPLEDTVKAFARCLKTAKTCNKFEER